MISGENYDIRHLSDVTFLSFLFLGRLPVGEKRQYLDIFTFYAIIHRAEFKNNGFMDLFSF